MGPDYGTTLGPDPENAHIFSSQQNLIRKKITPPRSEICGFIS